MGLPSRILVPTDFLPCSAAALSTAVALARNAGAEIVLTHVVEPSIPGYDEDLGVLEPEVLKTKLQVLATARKHALPISAKILHGKAAQEIVQFAANTSIDLIVMGTRGHSFLPEVLFGSVAESVLRDAPCPVIVVHCGSPHHQLPHDSLKNLEVAT